MLTVADLMSTHLITAGWDDVVGPIRDKMLDSGVHFVPVLDEAGEPVGVVSSWDLVEELQPDEPVATVMSTKVRTIGRSESIPEAAAAMRDDFLHHLIVVDEAGDMVGVISSFDILSFVADDLEASR